MLYFVWTCKCTLQYPNIHHYRFPTLLVLWLTSEIWVATLNSMFDNSNFFFNTSKLWISDKRFNKILTNRTKASILSPEMVEKPRKIVASEGDNKLAIVPSANKWVYIPYVLCKDFEYSLNYLDYVLESVFKGYRRHSLTKQMKPSDAY